MARLRRVWLYFAAICAVLLCACFFVAGEVGRTRALEDLEAAVRTDANLKMALLRAVLEHPRALPLVLSEDTELRDTLKGRSPTAIDGLNRKLETLVEGTRASVIYVVGLDGVAIASSNWGTTESFVGNDYSFREYFRLAIAGGGAEHYALGSVSHRPGLYISRRIDDVGGAAVGVVVVKTEFDGLEADWRSTGRPVFVSDDRGIVLLTSVPAWRFMAVQPIEPDRLKAIRDSLQFGEAPLLPLPYRPAEAGSAGSVARIALPGAARPNDYLDVAVPVPTTQWTLHHLAPLDPTVPASERESRLLWLAALVPLLAGAAVLLWRREAGIRRMAAEQDARMELERRVEARTVDLSRARDRLQQEIEVRQETEERLQAVQQNLVRANRLAILGQVAAGVAHEINQPVATIRAYADNARTFLDRSQLDPVRENLQFIAGLTERIGTITGELRGLARKGRAAAEPTGLADAIEGAVALLRTRFAGGMECLDIALPPADLKVSASRIRLEQVLINLLQNALEAVGAKEGGRVAVRVETSGEDEMALSVEDNGPGIAGDIRQALFTPFNTSKESGLGLGLVISKEILADYGGRIEVDSSDRGTRFTVYLKRA